MGRPFFHLLFRQKRIYCMVSMKRKERLHEAASCGVGAFDAGDPACFRTAAPAAACRRHDRPEHHDHRLVPVGPAVEPAGLHSLRAARAIYLSIYGVPRLFHRLHPAGGGKKSDRPLRQQERCSGCSTPRTGTLPACWWRGRSCPSTRRGRAAGTGSMWAKSWRPIKNKEFAWQRHRKYETKWCWWG